MKIIGLCGYARVGKDTAARYIIDKGWKRYAFADEVKKDVAILLRKMGLDPNNLTPEQKEIIRPIWVSYGEAMRIFSPDEWVMRVFLKIGRDEAEKVVITDVRHLNEVKAIIQAGGILVWIGRPNYKAVNDTEYKSLDEIEMSELFPGFEFINNEGTKDELGAKLVGIAERMNAGR